MTYATLLLVTLLNGDVLAGVVKDAETCRQFVEQMYDEKRHLMIQCKGSDVLTYVPPPKRRPW